MLFNPFWWRFKKIGPAVLVGIFYPDNSAPVESCVHEGALALWTTRNPPSPLDMANVEVAQDPGHPPGGKGGNITRLILIPYLMKKKTLFLKAHPKLG